MFEPSPTILRGDLRQCLFQRTLQMRSGAGSGRPQQSFDLAPGWLHRVVVGGVRRQIVQAHTRRLQGFRYASDFVGCEVVPHHDVTPLQFRQQHPFDKCPEHLAISGTRYEHRRADPAVVQRAQYR
jgi:hypothetical protein